MRRAARGGIKPGARKGRFVYDKELSVRGLRLNQRTRREQRDSYRRAINQLSIRSVSADTIQASYTRRRCVRGLHTKLSACPSPASTKPLARRHRLFAAIVVEASLGLASEPAGLDVFHQQRTGPVLR